MEKKSKIAVKNTNNQAHKAFVAENIAEIATPLTRNGANPLKPINSPLITTIKSKPTPKGLYSLEFMINSSPEVLYDFIATPGGLENWFADRVYIIEGNFIFNWEHGEKRMAKQILVKEGVLARYHWLDEPEDRYFEFKIQIDDLTGEVALIISDFADTPEELEESSLLWHSQVQDLLHSIGSY